MMPNTHIHEQLMLQRCQELQRDRAQQRLASELRRHHPSLPGRFASAIGARLLALIARMKRREPGREPGNEPVVYEKSSAQ
ncbi:MAG TPA: hypothetical protein VGT44_04840 [Ktedonobacteraceae bacterium]|nr:hypothetical protein [Ktedonobacteraceae bacterium]